MYTDNVFSIVEANHTFSRHLLLQFCCKDSIAMWVPKGKKIKYMFDLPFNF
jgi:hypothetical protein